MSPPPSNAFLPYSNNNNSECFRVSVLSITLYLCLCVCINVCVLNPIVQSQNISCYYSVICSLQPASQHIYMLFYAHSLSLYATGGGIALQLKVQIRDISLFCPKVFPQRFSYFSF